MIIDKLDNVSSYANMGTNVKKAFEFLKTTDLARLDTGKYPIDDEKVFAIVSEYETKELEKGLWEAHQKYIDIQYIISGQEKIGYGPIDEMKVKEEYNEQNDILFLSGQGDFFTVKEGMFAIFAPNDAHMPGIQVDGIQNVKKLVVKVLQD